MTKQVTIDKATESNPGTNTVTIPESQASRTIKSKSLDELLEKAAQVQRLAASMGDSNEYDLEVTYSIEADEWTGRLYKKW